MDIDQHSSKTHVPPEGNMESSGSNLNLQSGIMDAHAETDNRHRIRAPCSMSIFFDTTLATA